MKMQDYLVDNYCKELFPTLSAFLNDIHVASYYHVLSVTTSDDKDAVYIDEPYDAKIKKLESSFVDSNPMVFRNRGDAQNALLPIADAIRSGDLLPYKWMRQTSFTVITVATAERSELDTMLSAFDGIPHDVFILPKVFPTGGHALLIFNNSTLNSEIIFNEFKAVYLRMLVAIIAEERARYQNELDDMKAERDRLMAKYTDAQLELEKVRQRESHSDADVPASDSTPLYKLF